MRNHEIIDYCYVAPEHEAIHSRLTNWARWVRVHPHGWATTPMFRMFQSKARQWHAQVINDPVDTLDALLIERTVSQLPDKHRTAIRWSYVHCHDPLGMARRLAVTKQGLAELVGTGRTMVINKLR